MPTEKDLYYVDGNTSRKYWGIYRRKRSNRFGLFRLTTVCLSRQLAINQAVELLKQSPDYDYAVQSDNGPLPDSYNP
jgi:hypothetical protein